MYGFSAKSNIAPLNILGLLMRFSLIFLIAGTNYALAVQMVFSFKTPKELIQAAQATLVRKLKLDEKRAEKIHSFCRSLFQPDMTKRN